jgi:hypothetical protein
LRDWLTLDHVPTASTDDAVVVAAELPLIPHKGYACLMHMSQKKPSARHAKSGTQDDALSLTSMALCPEYELITGWFSSRQACVWLLSAFLHASVEKAHLRPLLAGAGGAERRL